MLHGVLRVHVPDQMALKQDGSKKLAAEHWYHNSSLPEDLNLYILDCYKREHPNANAMPVRYHAELDPLSDLQGDVQLHTMLNWIVKAVGDGAVHKSKLTHNI